ncbi:MAG: rhomboid family intramembrane serine protease [Spirochaetaceae bacterium]|jgi:membrane associated rhomboid family serine protease|nr:rhomboid family intramembrane serine protease [Spirochaetaceae bacterium]
MNVLRKPFRYRFDSVVFYIIGINVLVFLAQHLFRNVTYYLSMIPGLVVRGWVWQLATYMFVHDPRSLSHILFNMLGLLIFGIQVERRMGSREFLLYYFVTGTMAGIVSFGVYFFSGTNAILMGASGALFAVELAFAAFYPDTFVYIWGIIPLRAPVMVLGYTALELFFSFTGIQRGVAHFTHLSGFAAGWLYFVIRFGINPWRAFRGR